MSTDVRQQVFTLRESDGEKFNFFNYKLDVLLKKGWIVKHVEDFKSSTVVLMEKSIILGESE